MEFEVRNDELKRLIIRRAIKSGCNQNGTIVKYGGRHYYVNIVENRVVLQLEKK